ncbi:MAG: DUF6777-containing protein [Armatimonadota bacterium]|nr:DUF6777-containing protein [Armatimonadota bacterium]
MRAGLGLVFVLCWVSIALGAETLVFVPRNSFIIRPVGSAQALANQIRTEPIVAQRYARHFGIDAYKFAEYVEKNLRLSQLKQAQVFNVYYAPPDNRLMVVRRVLPKGTPVFVDKRTGKPVLKANCGNPLTPAVTIPTPQTQATLSSLTVTPTTPALVEALPEARMPDVELVELAEVPVEEVVTTDTLPVQNLTGALPENAPEPEVVVPPVASPSVPEVPIVTARPPNLLPLLPLLTLIPPRSGDDYEPIPEPSSIAILGAGLGLLYPLTRRTLRRSKNSSQRTGDSSTLSA